MPGSAGHRLIPAKWILLLGGNLALCILLLVLRADTAFSPFWDGWVANLVMVAPTSACLVYVIRGGPRRAGAAWLGAGMLCWTAGNVIFVAWTQFQADPPVPSPADFAYLGFYACVVAALVSLARREVGSVPRSLWLDGALGAAGAATALAAALNSVLVDTSGDLGAVIVGAGYSVADLLLVAMVCGLLAVHGLRGGSLWLWLAGGLAFFCAADVVYALQVEAGTYAIGTVLNVLWTTGISILALAIWWPQRPRSDESRRSAAVLAVPMLASLTAVAVLVVSSSSHMSPVVVALATLTLLLAIVRTFVSFRQVRGLSAARHQAVTDELTGLGNRRYLFEQGGLRLLGMEGSDRLMLMLIDLDNFKEVNDALGHQAGDLLLCETSRRLADRVRESDLLVRLGGDEFALVISLAAGDDPLRVAERALDGLSEPFVIKGARLRVDASAGVAVGANSSAGIGELLRQADLAMYAAKTANLRVQMHDARLDEANQARLETVRDIDDALEQNQFVLHYQPKMDVQTGCPLGAEALVRWQHPERGLLFPDAFLSVVEQSGKIGRLTQVVLETAIQQLAAWRADGLTLSVAVNLSASDLLDQYLAERIMRLLDKHDVPASELELEITESVLMGDRERATSVLEELHALGLRIAVDDYGTGYSSLAYLRDFPIDELKIDRSFINGMDADDRSAAIVSSTIDLAHALGLKVVAEGVEHARALRAITDFGCDYAQGYHFSRPLPAEDFAVWARPKVSQPEFADLVA